jgi:single-stranded DNA-binding protein
MYNSINTWIGEGNIFSLNLSSVQDKSVANFLLFIDESYSTDSSHKRRKVKVPIVAWAGKAEFLEKNFYEGDRVRVTGSIRTRVQENSDGSKKHTWEIVLSTIHLLSRSNETHY